MKDELLGLDYLIKVVLNPAKLKASELDKKFFIRNKVFAELELERIKQRFDVVAVETVNQSWLDIYFRKHQANLVILANKIFCYLQPGSPGSLYRQSSAAAVVELYEFLLAVSLELLEFIEQTFPRHFDQGKPISKARRAKESKGITNCIKQIKRELKGVVINKELIAILCAPLESFLLPEKTISYSDLNYLMAFRKGIHSFYSQRKIRTNEHLGELLIFLNFNSLRFLNYFTVLHKEACQEP